MTTLPLSPPTTTRVRALDPGRLAGTGALVFVLLLVVQNLIRASEPGFGAGPAAVSRYFADHRAAVLVPLVLFPIGMVALLGFAAGLRTLAREERDRFWVSLGTLAVVVLAGLFAVVNIVEIAIAAAGDGLSSSPAVLTALWAVHGAAFGLNLTAIALALVSLSRVARSHGLIPRAVAVVALVGAICLLVASLGTVSIAEGGPILYLGFLGFLAWGVFLVVCGVSLLRGGRPAAPAVTVAPAQPG